MESKKVTKKFLSSYTPCYLFEGTESTLFHDEKHILKFIKKEFLKDDRELVIKRLEELSHPSLAKPEFLLHDNTGFLGYGMNYYKDYESLNSLITNTMFYPNEKLPFNERKVLALKLCQLFDYINGTDYSFYDIHDKNILTNKELDLKLIDLDSGVFKDTINGKINYHTSYIHSSKQLALFALSFLYNTLFNEFEIAFAHPFSSLQEGKKEMLDYLPNDLKKFYEFALGREYYAFNGIGECIDKIDETTYNDTLQILQKRL